jgi:hypothetical protein
MKRTTIALAVFLAMTSAACAQSTKSDPQVASAQKGTASAGPSASASASEDPDAPLKFSQCMRAHGITWFPDPADGKMSVHIPKGTDPKKMEAAQEACKQFAPNGGEPPKMSAEDLQQARDMAKCMRENGVPNFPDPDPDGGIRIDGSKIGTGPGDPTFDKAEKACDKYMPQGATKQERA